MFDALRLGENIVKRVWGLHHAFTVAVRECERVPVVLFPLSWYFRLLFDALRLDEKIAKRVWALSMLKSSCGAFSPVVVLPPLVRRTPP